MKIKELLESVGQYVYHVTFNRHLPKIMTSGLQPLQTSNWSKADDPGKRYNEDGGVFAFADPEDAFKWAFVQQFEFKEPVSIVRLRRGDNWEKDPSGDINLTMGKGDALRSIAAVPAGDIAGVVSFDEFGSPADLGISQAEWIQNSVAKIAGQTTENTMRFNEFKNINEGMFMKDEILQRLLKWETSKRLQYGLKDFSVGGKSYGSIPSANINTVFYDMGLEGIGYSSGTMNYKLMTRAAHAAKELVDRVSPNVGGPTKTLKRRELAGFADALYDWYKFAHERMDAGVNIHDSQETRKDAEELGQTTTGRITEAPTKKAAPKKKMTAAQKKASSEKMRMAIQAGTVNKSQVWGLKKALNNIIAKYAKGPDWEVKNQYLDAGLYYVGDDLAEAERVGKEIVGALYGFFQDGARKSITKLKREEDNQTMTFTAIPTPDKFGDRNPPQISFVLHKNIQTDSPVIGIHINAAR